MTPISIPDDELVVGDIIKLKPGMMVPVDCILIQQGYEKNQKEINFQNKMINKTGNIDFGIVMDEEMSNGKQGLQLKQVIHATDLFKFDNEVRE